MGTWQLNTHLLLQSVFYVFNCLAKPCWTKLVPSSIPKFQVLLTWFYLFQQTGRGVGGGGLHPAV